MKTYTKQELIEMRLKMQFSEVSERVKEGFTRRMLEINDEKFIRVMRSATSLNICRFSDDLFIIK
jgi:hypothetical protein